MRYSLGKKLLQSERAPQSIEVGEPESANPIRKRLTYPDPSTIIFIVTIIMAVSLLALLRRENLSLKSKLMMSSSALAGSHEAQPGDITPPFCSVNLESQAVNINFDGVSKRLLYIFSPTCGECFSQFPVWNRLTATAKSRNLIVHGVSIDGLEESRSHLKRIEHTFEIVLMPNESVKRAYRVVHIPEVLLLSPDGIVEWVSYGALTDEKTKELESRIKTLPEIQ